MQTLDTRTLISSGRALMPTDAAPTVLQWQDENGEAQSLELLKVLRILPEKRVVALARWRGQHVLAKLFFARVRWPQHLQREIDGVQAIVTAGIATPAVLASGTSVDGGTGVLLLQYIESSETVGQRWGRVTAAEREILLRKVVTLIADCHGRGLVQKDIHLDNFLLSNEQLPSTQSQNEVVYLLDAAAVSVHPGESHGVDSVRSLQNLALLFAQFPVQNDAQVPALYALYCSLRPQLEMSVDPCMFSALLQQNRLARLRVVLDKLYRETSAHACVQKRDRFVVYRRALESPQLQEFLQAPDDFIARGRLLKNGNSSTVALVQIAGRDYVLKRYNIKSFWHGLRRALRPSRAWVSWRNAHMLEMLGVATPQPLLMMERRCGALRREAYFLSEFVAGEDVLRYLAKEPINSAAWERVLTQFGQLFQVMCDYHIVHGDMKATNFISTAAALIVLDLDAMRKEPDKERFRNAFGRDLQRFIANWQDKPECAARVLTLVEQSGQHLTSQPADS
ncbi:MAG: lipopolysaccharide kinase InaA family protein [Gammaproteobacteria bacterium]|nr:lipopolysaccharide kinase InaA family protein [Gammaproteobacteria bacterium]